MATAKMNAEARALFEKHVKSLAPTQTGRCNHEGCPAGEDTRQRMYFTRKTIPENLVVWYCHNCTEGGAFKTVGKGRLAPCPMPGLPAMSTEQTTQYISDVMARSVDINTKPKQMTRQQREWLYPFKEVSYPNGRILFDPMDHSLVFPISTVSQENRGALYLTPDAMQKRYHRDHGPKCITTKANEDVRVRSEMWPVTGGSAIDAGIEPVVVVEDALSGIRLNMDTGMRSYVLYGAHMDITEMVEYKNIFEQGVIVWLDNDNDKVTENSMAIEQRFKMLGVNVIRVSGEGEAKHQTPEELRDWGAAAKRSFKYKEML